MSCYNIDLSGKPVDQKNYHAIIGSLLYLTASRPDIVFCMGLLEALERKSTKSCEKVGKVQKVKQKFFASRSANLAPRRGGFLEDSCFLLTSRSSSESQFAVKEKGRIDFMSVDRGKIVTRSLLSSIRSSSVSRNPRDSHLSAVKRILRYLKGTSDFGLWYPKDSSFELIAYTDSDHAGCKLNRKITSEAYQFLGEKLVSWSSQKQNCISLSTAEAEYVVAASSLDENTTSRLWLHHAEDPGVLRLQECNSNHGKLNFGYTMQRILVYFIKDHAEKGNIELYFVESDLQLADLFIKPFYEKHHFFLLSKLRMLDLPAED
ncbi:hypothetical protein OSB04_006061 [Centaurea solstitialis]|uniref:Uncharacterized protein n=1 Tax=Centaurea solstitialis TaxID=347529 RepID=A0AA38WSG0_9ASTR|nr:hypothetical protein OSB04_006061 [Centaurea solstitialis]